MEREAVPRPSAPTLYVLPVLTAKAEPVKEVSLRSTVPAEMVPAVQPQAVNEPAITKKLGLPVVELMSSPETENVYVPFRSELLKPPEGGATGRWVLLPPHATRKARPNTVVAGRNNLRSDIQTPWGKSWYGNGILISA